MSFNQQWRPRNRNGNRQLYQNRDRSTHSEFDKLQAEVTAITMNVQFIGELLNIFNEVTVNESNRSSVSVLCNHLSLSNIMLRDIRIGLLNANRQTIDNLTNSDATVHTTLHNLTPNNNTVVPQP